MKKMLRYIAPVLSFATLGSQAGAQSIGSFSSIAPTAQTANLEIPSTHTFQRIIRSGTPLATGGNLGNSPDFTGYVPIAGSSTNGYLSISSETPIGECAILNMNLNPLTKLWEITGSGKIDFPFADIGFAAVFCSGTVTPNNTIMVGEEAVLDIDGNNDSYQDVGWLIEIDPATRTVKKDGTNKAAKLWALGRQKHENITIKADQSVAYWGADDGSVGYLYKFVPGVTGDFGAGLLYVLETNGAGSGTWKLIANTTKAERNNTIASSTTAGAHNFNRIEDVEIGPDGEIYFSSTATGNIYRLTDDGSTVSGLEIFVASATYDVDGEGPAAPVLFNWPDNLAFDGDGNLWVLQDGGDNHIWVVAPSHTALNPAIKVFANTPVGSEPTGITFSPDYKFLFLSIQHPDGSNNVSQPDAAGSNVVFDNHTTIVIARNENLGVGSVLPLRFVDLTLERKRNGVALSWKVAGADKHAWFDIERSNDGINFRQIARNQAAITNAAPATFSYTDNTLPASGLVWYRIRSCSVNGACIYSPTKSIRVAGNKRAFKISPLPARENLHVTFQSIIAETISLQVFSNDGKELYTLKRKVSVGQNDVVVPLKDLSKGMYVISINAGGKTESQSFLKQ